MKNIWEDNYPSSVTYKNSYDVKDLFSLLEKTANNIPDSEAVVFLKNRLTYKELFERSIMLSNGLYGLGIKKGTKVGIMLPNCPQNIISFFALMRLGAVVVMINPMYVGKEVERQVNDAGAEFLITLDMFYEKIQNIRKNTSLKKIIVTKIQEHMSGILKIGYLLKLYLSGKHANIKLSEEDCLLSELYSKMETAVEKPDIDPCKDIALLQYTGGTTGFSKGVVLTHKNLFINSSQASLWFSTAEYGKEKFLSILPFFHAFGLTICMNTAINLGASMIILPKFDLKIVLKEITAERPTIFPGVPSMYIAINSYSGLNKYDLSSLKFCISGAAPMPVEALRKFESITQSRLLEGYGLTEASPVTHATPITGEREIGSIGFPFPDTCCKIVDIEDNNKELGVNEIGELAVKGPQVMEGYWNKDDETKAILRDGWLYTGDIARMDEKGFFYIVDRKKDIIISGGYNIYPRDVEEVLYAHPKIQEAVVAGIEDNYLGEIVKAYIVLKDGEKATGEEIKDYCKKELAKYKIPRKVEFRDSLPKNIIGKVLRRILKEEENNK